MFIILILVGPRKNDPLEIKNTNSLSYLFTTTCHLKTNWSEDATPVHQTLVHIEC